jgi:hypothetical protein
MMHVSRMGNASSDIQGKLSPNCGREKNFEATGICVAANGFDAPHGSLQHASKPSMGLSRGHRASSPRAPPPSSPHAEIHQLISLGPLQSHFHDTISIIARDKQY